MSEVEEFALIQARVRQFAAQPLERNGERVILLDQVDEFHQLRPGTARKTFNQNRHRFTESKHYHATARREPHSGAGRNSPAAASNLERILLTKRGYVMLVKPFTDELSWAVQEALVDGYFDLAEKQAGPVPQPPVLLPWGQRITQHFLTFKANLTALHPDRWAVAPEVLAEALVVEDHLAAILFPLHDLDLPDGSIGRRWADHRREIGLTAARLQDVGMTTPNPLCPIVFPWSYPNAELPIFRRWFTRTYLTEGLPDYLYEKLKRDRPAWRSQGLVVPEPRHVIQAADRACCQLTGNRISVRGPLLTLRDQNDLFDRGLVEGG